MYFDSFLGLFVFECIYFPDLCFPILKNGPIFVCTDPATAQHSVFFNICSEKIWKILLPHFCANSYSTCQPFSTCYLGIIKRCIREAVKYYSADFFLLRRGGNPNSTKFIGHNDFPLGGGGGGVPPFPYGIFRQKQVFLVQKFYFFPFPYILSPFLVHFMFFGTYYPYLMQMYHFRHLG